MWTMTNNGVIFNCRLFTNRVSLPENVTPAQEKRTQRTGAGAFIDMLVEIKTKNKFNKQKLPTKPPKIKRMRAIFPRVVWQDMSPYPRKKKQTKGKLK